MSSASSAVSIGPGHRALARMPWHRTRVRITSTWLRDGDGEHCAGWHFDASGTWGGARVVLRGTGRPAVPLDGFGEIEWSRIHSDPFVGWYRRTGADDSAVGRYSVWHEPLALEDADVEEARCTVFTDLGLITPSQMPVFAGIQRRIRFDVHTPPVREHRSGSA